MPCKVSGDFNVQRCPHPGCTGLSLEATSTDWQQQGKLELAIFSSHPCLTLNLREATVDCQSGQVSLGIDKTAPKGGLSFLSGEEIVEPFAGL